MTAKYTHITQLTLGNYNIQSTKTNLENNGAQNLAYLSAYLEHVSMITLELNELKSNRYVCITERRSRDCHLRCL